ncbi:MAG: hypothetical protein GVY07_08865 [Bacteroidetes bacterium]|jgi:hypothetical protein|nr:hypothetical protein [Bacteroidota bacterium]
MRSKNNRHKILKIGLTIGLVLLLIIGGIQVFLSFYLDDLVENRLLKTISEQTLNQYQLGVGELTLSVWNRKMELNNVSIHPTNSSSTAPKIEFDQFSISGIQFLPYLWNGSVSLADVHFLNPTVRIIENSPDSLVFLNQTTDSPSNQKDTPNISVDRFIVEGGSVSLQNSDQSRSRAELHDFNLMISGVRMDSTSRLNVPYFDFDSLTTSSGNFRYAFKNGLYAIESNQTKYSTTANIASLDSLKLIPQYPRYEFARKIGHQKDRITLTVGQLRLKNPDIENLKSGKLIADRFTIDAADLDVFHSKLVPDGPDRVKIFPHMAFKNLKFPVTIDTIAINQSEISYSEHLPEVNRPGTVTFSHVNGMFENVTNDSTTISLGHEITLDVSSDVMGVAKLDAHFVLPMNEDGGHTARGTLASMQATELNPILEPVGLIRTERGTIHSLQFLMDLKANSASGWTQLVYSDLKIAVLDSDHVNDGGRKWLKSVLANLLKVKENNNKEPFRRGEISKEREETKSMFSYWWKSLSTGLKDNIGL